MANNTTPLTLEIQNAALSDVKITFTGNSSMIDPLTAIIDAVNLDSKSLFLHLENNDDKLISFSESVEDFVESFIIDSQIKKMPELIDFFDLLLVSKKEFNSQIIHWKSQLKEINTKVDEILNTQLKEPKFAPHKGMIIFSSTDDIEAKVINHYGGVKWKRIMHFIRGGVEEIGKRGGAEYVCLTRDNICPHTHSISGDINKKYKWVLNQSSGSSAKLSVNLTSFNEGIDQAVQVDSFHMRTLLTGMDYENDVDLVIPHRNLPTYLNCYIWECVQVDETKTNLEDQTWAMSLWEKQQRRQREIEIKNILNTTVQQIERNLEHIVQENALNMKGAITEAMVETKLTNLYTDLIHNQDNLEGFYLLLSEKITDDRAFRYDSHLIEASDLADVINDKVFNEILRLDYLMRIEYREGIKEIYFLIYTILSKMHDIDEALEDNDKFTVQPGQYVFMYDDGSLDINDAVIIPDSYHLAKISSCFFRGVTNVDKGMEADPTSAGANILDLTYDYIPHHQHLSSVIDLSSSSGNALVMKPSGDSNRKLKKGAMLTKGNQISSSEGHHLNIGYENGDKFTGLGDLSFTTSDTGVQDSFKHSNIPPFIVLSCWQVVKNS